MIIVYTGPEPSKTLRGVTFPRGKGVEVSDTDFVSRLVARADFEAGHDTAPLADPIETRAGALAEEVNLERIGLLAVARRLDLSLPADADDQEIADAVMEAFEARAVRRGRVRVQHYSPASEPEPLEVPEVAPGTIPADWEGLHWKQRVRLAKDIAPELADVIVTKEDADEVIREKITPR